MNRLSRAVLVLIALTWPAFATVEFTVSGTSAGGTPVSFKADLSISAGTLTVQLFNNSTVSSASPKDLLSSFFFDIVDTQGNRPTLVFDSATGDVWISHQRWDDDDWHKGRKTDDLKHPPDGKNGWDYRSLVPEISPFLGFGISTVGNSDLAPNNFNGKIVGDFAYSIYAGDLSTASLSGRYLVKDSATFTFSGLGSFTESEIGKRVVFGLGGGPDSLMAVPEPKTWIVAVLLLVPLIVSSIRILHRRTDL